ncbi:MAG: hypothetical protein IPH30_10725 [Betaproteobacteria bacterium]|nr:hypothetical protein [Betaproteobacteria bacterium]
MSKLEKLDLMGVASLAIVTAAVLVAWMVTTHGAIETTTRQGAQEGAVTLTRDGSMKLVVTADAGNASAPVRAARTASTRASRRPTLDVAMPVVFRP